MPKRPLPPCLRRAAFALWTFGAPCASIAAAAGTEGASFLEIPVGGRPAALGGAYDALAADAYAPVYNPGGLGFLPSTQLSGMHLDYAGAGAYEFVSLVHPFGTKDGLGVSAQYYHQSGIPALDADGNSIGTYSTYYGAYSLALGRAFDGGLSLGATVKLIDARLADVSASAVAGDAGALYRVGDRVSLSAVAANVGGGLKFLQQSDPLAENYRLGVLYAALPTLSLAAGSEYARATRQTSGAVGAEWRPLAPIALRAGYRSETTTGLSPMAGLTTGVGLELFGQRFDYAWVPLGGLGQTQYFSVVVSFGGRRAADAPSPTRIYAN